MKCPWRNGRYYPSSLGDSFEEVWGNCYEEDCPYWKGFCSRASWDDSKPEAQKTEAIGFLYHPEIEEEESK